MKETIKHLFPILLSTTGALFFITIFFSGISGTENGIFTDIGQYLSEITPKDNLTSVASAISVNPETPLPSLKYVGHTLTVGEMIPFYELFELHYEDGTTINAKSDSNTQLYLIDVKNTIETSVLTKLSSAEVEALEELPSVAIYDKDSRLLCFHKSGIYKIFIRMYYENLSPVLYECSIPVEVR